MANLPKTIKIHELPEISEINDTDIFIIEDGSKTYKITGKSLIECIKNNTDIGNYFVHQTSVNNKNGIAPLDENKKVPIENLLVGTTSGTLFDGGRGKALEDSWDAHLLDNNDPHGSNAYTDQKIADLINGAPTTLDTLKEIADAMSENEEVVEALESAIGNKANQSDLTNHIDDYTVHVTEEEKTTWNNMASGGTGISSLGDLGVTATATELNYMDGVTSNVQTQLDNKVTAVSGKGLSTNDYTTTEKNKLSGISSGAEVNQNAFSNVKVGSTTIAADTKTDTLELVAGSNVTITPDATNDKITISSTDTKYTHPTSHSASMITAGTFAGKVVGNATAVATLGDKQFRNIYAGTGELTSGSSSLPTGDIYIQYE